MWATSIKLMVDGKLFSYITSGVEGSLDDIAGNLADQINTEPGTRVKATVVSGQITITAIEIGATYNVAANRDQCRRRCRQHCADGADPRPPGQDLADRRADR